ncbi:UNVERIFIED_CONTAM: hypothetical protein Slati_1525600 [Sesamum latifolium]|uniref:Retrotransposon gag domain-containing protein n=1 Tax=Sesamum latifolium TaxID=2727402 RepID=A0AAW2X6L9_9LAMI
MQTRPRTRDVHGVDTTQEMQVNGAGQAPPHEQAPFNGEVMPPHEQAHLNEEFIPPHEQASPPHPVNLPPPSPRRSRELSSTPGRRSRGRKRGVDDPYLPLAVAPPRRSPFSRAILAEALPASVKVSNLSEYDVTGDPQEHLDKFYAKINWYDLSDAAYCKVFRTTLSKRALAWFNQLPAGTISSLEQLTQYFLHHFFMNKRVPKTAAFLFTIRQKENEPLRDYMQRFVEAVHEVPHVNHELLASIIQNLLPGRFKESIAGKPPSTMEDLLMQSQKYIKIEESNVSNTSLNVRRKGREEEKEPKKEERKHLASRDSRITPP